MNRKYETEVRRLAKANNHLFTAQTLHIVNGQYMYDALQEQASMQNSQVIPFNEAMCVHTSTHTPFDSAFMKERASGHGQTIQQYTEKVITPLEPLFKQSFDQIVLWFGIDMFCQMNALTILAYLEEVDYDGKVYLHYFKDEKFDVRQMELSLTNYLDSYQQVMAHHERPKKQLYPILDEAIAIYIDMLTEDNPVCDFIKENKDLATKQLVKQLLQTFPEVGYGDTQYLELIHQYKKR